MAKIRKRSWTNKKGDQEAWIVDYRDQYGRRHIETYPTRKKADEARRRIEGDVDRGIHTPASGSPTVAGAGEAWIKQAETDGLDRATRRQYRQHLDLHIKPFLGEVKLSALTVALVKKFRNDLIANGRSRVMAKKVVSSLGAILHDAQSANRVAQNVVHAEAQQNKTAARRRRMVEKRQERKIEEGVDYPTKDELRRMLAVSSVPDRRGRRDDGVDPVDLPQRSIPGWHALLVTAVFSGLRASELRALTWPNIEFVGDTVIIKVRRRADRWNDIEEVTKSKSSNRDVEIVVPYAINTLKAWREKCPKGPRNLVFPNSKGNVETLPTIHNRGLAPLQQAAGIVSTTKGPKYGMHSLRHVAASLWIDLGYNPKRVQALMGHSTIAMTLDTYTHLWKDHDHDAEAIAKLQARLVA
jgi:integrase